MATPPAAAPAEPAPETARSPRAVAAQEITLPETPESAANDDAYDRAIDRAFEATVRRGRHAARPARATRPALEAAKVKQVLTALEERGLAGFGALPSHLRGLACYEALLARSWALRFDDSKQMVQLAELATVVAANLSTRRHGREQVHDFQCRASVELANAYRVVNQLDEAQSCLNEAIESFRRGSQDRLLGARLFVVQGLVFGDRRSFDAAFAAFDDALKVYRVHGEPHLVSDTLITRGMYTGYAGQSEAALALLHEGLATVDAEEHPALALFAIHNIATILIDLGRFREARTLIWRNLQLYNQHGGQATRLRLRWLEGRIHAGVGEHERAERAFQDARRGFAEAGKPYLAALVLLELAVLIMRQGRDEQARALALEAAEIFLSLEIGREATVAMMLLKSTVKLRVATTALLFEEMAKFMCAAENDPKATFHSYLT
ncbi:MAG TPA: tetratricopeptide repeat protein [Thermoanaerobaculia bacterium]|nr:tetratricopeptide repeat protein [Thermoanaerobaculia bacterium]